MKYKIEVSVRDAGKALDIIQDSPFLRKQINKEATNYYSTSKQDVAEELYETLKQQGVEILSDNVYAGNGAKIKGLDEWWYSLPESTREYLFIHDRDTSWDVDDSDRVWDGLSESKKTEIKNALERNPGDEISVKYALDLPGKYRSGYYLEKEIIQNQYDGKTPEQVWNAWTEDQRTHFIKDHFDEINRAGNSEGIQYGTWISASNLLEKQSYRELSRPVKQILQTHITSGQYGKGTYIRRKTTLDPDQVRAWGGDWITDSNIEVIKDSLMDAGIEPYEYMEPRRFSNPDAESEYLWKRTDELVSEIRPGMEPAGLSNSQIRDIVWAMIQASRDSKYSKYGKGGGVDDFDASHTVKIHKDMPYMASLDGMYDKELPVVEEKTYHFASGPKNYYVVEFEGREYEVPEDMVDNSIPNNYEGKTPEQVWNAWTEDQREHFLKDHFKDKINPISQSEIIKSNYSGLFNWWNFNIKEKLEEHLKSGQYGKGGGVDDFDASHTVKIHKDMPYMASLDGMYDKELPVVEEKTYHFASGPQIYYVVKFNGKLTEIPRRFTEAGYNEMAGKGAHLKADEFQEAAEFLMDKTVFSYSLGQLEPTEHKIKGVHITPKHFNQRHLYFSFYGNEWPHNFNDYDRLTSDQLGDFIAGEQVELKDSQGEPYIVALGDIASKGTKITVPRMEPEELTDVLYSKENNWADIGQAQMYVYQTPSVSDYLKRLHIIDLTGQSASKIKYPDGVYVFIAKVGNRYYYVNTEGYDYARYAVEIPGWFAREINMEKAAKGAKINEMENKNYYYLKIGNIITDSKNNVYEITGYKKDGILMKRISDFTPGDGVPFETEFEELESKLKSKLVKISTVKHVRDSLNNVLRSINEDLIFSTSRDEALLEMEIADIKNSFKIAEEKAEVRKKEEEVAQAKHEADVLLKKATDTEAAAKDTIEAMEAMITEERHGWQIGKIADYDFEAKVFEQPSEYGINNGRISKLWVYKKVNGKKNTAINYDRGWDIRPTTVKDKKVLKTILSMFPVNADQAGKGKKVGYNPDMFYKKGEEVRVLTGYYKGKNGIVHDVDHDANHIEVEMGDGMIRFLELSDVKKNESNEHKAGKGAKVGDYKIKQGKETNSYGHDIDNILKKGILVIGKKGTKNEGKEFIVRQHTSLNPDLFVLLPTERGNNKTFVANVENYEVKQGWEKAGKGTKVGDLATLTEEENKAWQTAFEYYLNEGKSDSQADKLAWKDLQAEFPRLKDFSGIKEDKSPVQEDFYQAKKSKTQKGKWAILKNGEVIEDGLDEYFAGTTANKRNAEIEYAKMESKKAKAEKPKVGKSTKIKEFGRASVNRILNKALREYEKETGNKLFKKEAKIGKYYHFRLNNPKGVKKCAVPSWASDLAGSVYEGAKITTCQKDGEWFAQNVMIPTKNISKLQARSYAQQIALKIKK